MYVDSNKNGYDVYRCDECYSATGRSPAGTGLPDGWTESVIGSRHFCPRCTAKREAKEAEWKAKDQAKKMAKRAKNQAAKEARAAYDATPEGKKERNIAALSAVAAVLLFFLFAGVFHLIGVAFIIGFIAGAPFFWFRARKAGFVILVLILLVLVAKFNESDSADDESNANTSQTSEVVAPANSQIETASKQTSTRKKELVNQSGNAQKVALKKAMKEIIPAMKVYKKKAEAYKTACKNGCNDYPTWNVIGFKMPKSEYFEFQEGTELGGIDWKLEMDAKEDVLGTTCHWIIRCISTENCICNISEDCKDISPNLKSICEVEYDEY